MINRDRSAVSIFIESEMKISGQGKQKIAEFEGLETHIYKDAAGYPTIGVGHLLTREELGTGEIVINGERVSYLDGLTEQQCFDLLDEDLHIAEDAVNLLVNVDLTQNQFDALVSLVFNIGVGAFSSSTLLKLLNDREYDEIPLQFMRWVRSGKRVLPGLVNRRKKEVAMWRENDLAR